MNLESISSENLDKEMAYLLGVYLTDGSIVRDSKWKSCWKFSLKSIDREFPEFTLECLKKHLPECEASVSEYAARERFWEDGRVSKCQKQYGIAVGFTKYAEWFREQTGEKHHIPFIIWKAPLQIKKWFIAGVMDGDGYITSHTRPDGSFQWKTGLGGVAEGWVHDFKNLLHQMGIGTNKEEIKKYKGGPFVTFTIKIKDFSSHGLFFTIKRKVERLKKYRGTFRD